MNGIGFRNPCSFSLDRNKWKNHVLKRNDSSRVIRSEEVLRLLLMFSYSKFELFYVLLISLFTSLTCKCDCRVQIKASAPLGKLSTYTRVLTQPVAADEVEALAKRLLQQHPGSQHHLRHHQLCPPAPRVAPPESADVERCRKRKKRRKRRR